MRNTAPSSGKFENTPCWNSDARSDRIASTWPIWERVRTVNTIVCQWADATMDRVGLGDQRHARHGQPDPQDMLPHAMRKYGLAGRSRRSLHNRPLRRLRGERQARKPIGDQIDPENVDRQQRNGQPQERGQQNRPDLGGVTGKDVADELSNVVEDPPTLFDGDHDRGKVVVEEHEARSLARHICALFAHGDADIGSGERRRIIDPVARHSHKLAAALKGCDDPKLLRRINSGKDAGPSNPLGEVRVGDLRQFSAG